MTEPFARVTGTFRSDQQEGIHLRVITGVCTSVQSAVLNLAEGVLAADLTHDTNAHGQLLAATQEVRGQVRTHRLETERPAGLFDYFEDSSAHLSASLDALRTEHEELDQCLEELETLLKQSPPVTPQAADQIRRCATWLSDSMRRHRSSVDGVAREVSDE